jgi:hypothetical protein
MNNDYTTLPIYFNYAGELCYVKSLVEKIDILLEKKICYIDEEEFEFFIRELIDFIELEKEEGNSDDIITKMDYLTFSPTLHRQLAENIETLLINTTNEQSFLGSKLKTEFEEMFDLAFDLKNEKKIIKKYLKITKTFLKGVISTVQISDFHKYLSNMNLPDLALGFVYILAADRDVNLPSCSEKRSLLRRDCLNHVRPPAASPELIMYDIGQAFLIIQNLNNFYDFLKNKLARVSHIEIRKKDAQDSNYNIGNVSNQNNRFPLVFKDGYCCELFLYIFSNYKLNSNIIFSYYYEVFKDNKLFKKNLKIQDYLDFINIVYNLKEKRIRKELSTKKLNSHINSYIKFKKSFDKETASEIN